MKQKHLRQIAGWIILAVYLPILLVSSLHTHAAEELDIDSCAECVSHQNCPGHITEDSVGLHECVLCQFLTLPYLTATIIATVFALQYKNISRAIRHCSVCNREAGIVGLRAPPFSL